MQSFRLCILCNTLSAIHAFRLPLIKEVLKKSSSVLIFAHIDGGTQDYINKNCTIYDVDIRASRSIKKIFKAIFLIYSKKNTSGADLLVAYGIFSVLFAPFVRSKLKVLFVTGLGSGYVSGVVSRLQFILLLIFANFIFDKVVVLNKADKAVVSRFFKRKVIVNFGEGQDIYKIKSRNHDHTGGAQVYSYVGRLVKDKGIVDFFKICRAFPSLNFSIFGDLDENNPSNIARCEFDRLLSTSPNVVWHKFQCKEKIWNKTDCLIMTSKREGLSTVVLEAVRNGVLVVGYSIPGVIDIFEELKIFNPALVPLGDEEALIQQIKLSRYQRPYDCREAQRRLEFLLEKNNAKSLFAVLGGQHVK